MNAYNHLRSAPHGPGQHITKPASALWIVCTIVLSYLLNVIKIATEVVWLPDFISITLVFWAVHQPRSVGMFAAFCCGILMDAHTGSVLGQQPLAYVTLSFLAYSLHRRLPWFGLIGQALHVLPLLVLSQILVMLVRLWFDGLLPAPVWFVQSLAGAALWPVWTHLMTLPQRRSGAAEL